MKGKMKELILAKLISGRACEEREMDLGEINVVVVGLTVQKGLLLTVLTEFFLMLPVLPLV